MDYLNGLSHKQIIFANEQQHKVIEKLTLYSKIIKAQNKIADIASKQKKRILLPENKIYCRRNLDIEIVTKQERNCN